MVWEVAPPVMDAWERDTCRPQKWQEAVELSIVSDASSQPCRIIPCRMVPCAKGTEQLWVVQTDGQGGATAGAF